MVIFCPLSRLCSLFSLDFIEGLKYHTIPDFFFSNIFKEKEEIFKKVKFFENFLFLQTVVCINFALIVLLNWFFSALFFPPMH